MRIKDQRGGSLVEFAIIMPLIFILLFGIIDFSILLYDKAMLTNASREGARAGIVFSDPRPSNAQIEAVVRNYCETHLISFGGSGLTIPPPTRTGTASGDSLMVRVNYQYSFLAISNLVGLFGGTLANLTNLSAVTVMRLE